MRHLGSTYIAGVLTALLVCVAACATNPPHMSPEDAEQAILDAERRALDRWAEGDPMGYWDPGAEDITMFDDIGSSTRKEGGDAFRGYLTSLEGKVPPHRYEIVSPKVQVYGDIGILTLHHHTTALDGTPGAPWKATSVYRWQGNKWQIVHSHWSKVDESQP